MKDLYLRVWCWHSRVVCSRDESAKLRVLEREVDPQLLETDTVTTNHVSTVLSVQSSPESECIVVGIIHGS